MYDSCTQTPLNCRASSSDPHIQLSGLLTLWARSDPEASWDRLATAVSKIPKYGRGTARRIRIKAGIKTESKKSLNHAFSWLIA